MLLARDVEDDLLDWSCLYYSNEDGVLIYQNGRDSPRYVVTITVTEE